MRGSGAALQPIGWPWFEETRTLAANPRVFAALRRAHYLNGNYARKKVIGSFVDGAHTARANRPRRV
jgi:hypothetical protein